MIDGDRLLYCSFISLSLSFFFFFFLFFFSFRNDLFVSLITFTSLRYAHAHEQFIDEICLHAPLSLSLSLFLDRSACAYIVHDRQFNIHFSIDTLLTKTQTYIIPTYSATSAMLVTYCCCCCILNSEHSINWKS